MYYCKYTLHWEGQCTPSIFNFYLFFSCYTHLVVRNNRHVFLKKKSPLPVPQELEVGDCYAESESSRPQLIWFLSVHASGTMTNEGVRLLFAQSRTYGGRLKVP